MTEHAVVVCANEKSDIKYLSYLLGTLNLGRLSGQSAQPGLSVKLYPSKLFNYPIFQNNARLPKFFQPLTKKLS